MLDCIFNPENYFPEINDNFLYFVEVMILWFRDILYLKKDMNIKYLVFQEEINAIKRYAQYYSENNLMNILEYLSIIPEELKRHINKNTLLENFFIRLGD